MLYFLGLQSAIVICGIYQVQSFNEENLFFTEKMTTDPRGVQFLQHYTWYVSPLRRWDSDTSYYQFIFNGGLGGSSHGVPFCHQYYSLFSPSDVKSLQLATLAFKLLLPGGDSSYPWASVCALGHNLSTGGVFNISPLQVGVESARKYTGLHTWTLYSTLLRWYQVSTLQLRAAV